MKKHALLNGVVGLINLIGFAVTGSPFPLFVAIFCFVVAIVAHNVKEEPQK